MCVVFFFFFQAEDGIRDLVRSRGLGDVYKRQGNDLALDGALHVGDFLGPLVDEHDHEVDFWVVRDLSLIHI